MALVRFFYRATLRQRGVYYGLVSLCLSDCHKSEFYSDRADFLRGGASKCEYIGCRDVTESMATIQSPFCGYNMA